MKVFWAFAFFGRTEICHIEKIPVIKELREWFFFDTQFSTLSIVLFRLSPQNGG